MKIRVLREACCAQDDQMGPLEASHDVSPTTTLAELVAQIVGSNFLQYSSSHVSLQGEVDGRPVVRIFSPYCCDGGEPAFLVSDDQPVAALVGNHSLQFRFVFE